MSTRSSQYISRNSTRVVSRIISVHEITRLSSELMSPCGGCSRPWAVRHVSYQRVALNYLTSNLVLPPQAMSPQAMSPQAMSPQAMFPQDVSDHPQDHTPDYMSVIPPEQRELASNCSSQSLHFETQYPQKEQDFMSGKIINHLHL